MTGMAPQWLTPGTLLRLMGILLAAACAAYPQVRLTTAFSPPTEGPKQEDRLKQALHEMAGGMGLNELKRFEQDKATVPALLRILSDPRQQDIWPKAVLVLGWIGRDERSVVYPLMDFVQSAGPLVAVDQPTNTIFSGPFPAIYPVAFEAKRNALLALGYILQNPANSLRDTEPRAEAETDPARVAVHQNAFRYLAERADRQYWMGRIGWRSRPLFKTDQQRNADLSAAAREGLGIACDRDRDSALAGLDAGLREQVLKLLRSTE